MFSENKVFLLSILNKKSWDTWIRTKIHGFKVRFFLSNFSFPYEECYKFATNKSCDL